RVEPGPRAGRAARSRADGFRGRAARDRRCADTAHGRGSSAGGAEGGSSAMTTSTFDLTGLTAVVSGSGRGLGRAMAKGLAKAGAKVVCGARSMPEVEETAAEIVAAGGHAFAVHLDATKPAECKAMVERAVQSGGGLDIAVVNHGIG